jgi:1-acyl-sn-glycerol-3-phosphate acyltransferase
MKLRDLKRGILFLRSMVTLGVFTTILGSIGIVLAALDRTGRAIYVIGRIWSRLLFLTNGVKLRIYGLENVVKKKSYVFISNHQSHLDICAVVLALRTPVKFVYKKSLENLPIFGQALKLGKMIPIDRSDTRKAIESINRSMRELKNGIGAFFFGEGTRTRDGMLQPFKKGGAIFSINTGLPIMPVTVVNSFSLLPKGALHIESGTIGIIFDEEISPAGYTMENAGDLLDRVRNVIAENIRRYDAEPARV